VAAEAAVGGQTHGLVTALAGVTSTAMADKVKAAAAEPLPSAPPILVDAASNAKAVHPKGVRQCALSPAQVEEIYAKLELHERRDLADWALETRSPAFTPDARLAFSDGTTAQTEAMKSTRLSNDAAPCAPFAALCRKRGPTDVVAGAYA